MQYSKSLYNYATQLCNTVNHCEFESNAKKIPENSRCSIKFSIKNSLNRLMFEKLQISAHKEKLNLPKNPKKTKNY